MKKFFLLTFCWSLLLISASAQDVIIHLHAASRGVYLSLDTIVMVNITQPDTILFSGLPADTTLYHVNLTQGFIINAIEDHETEGSGALLINRPGHSRVTIRSSINEPIHCRIMDMSGRIVYESALKCMACNPCLQITTGKDPVYILSVSGASFSSTFKLTGGAQTDGFSIEEIACSSDLKSFRLHPSAGDFKYTPGDWIRFHTSKTGYYSNQRTSAPESGDTVLVWMSEPCPDVRTVTDIDGNVYQTVQIGSQCWMREMNIGIRIMEAIEAGLLVYPVV